MIVLLTKKITFLCMSICLQLIERFTVSMLIILNGNVFLQSFLKAIFLFFFLFDLIKSAFFRDLQLCVYAY